MKLSTIFTWLAIAVTLVLVSLWMAQQSYSWLPVQAAAESILIDNLFAFLVFLGTMIFLGVTGFIGYCVATGTVSRFDNKDGPHIEGNVRLEVVWTVIPIVLVFVIAGYSYKTYEQMAVRGPMEVVHLHMGSQPAYAAGMDMDGEASDQQAMDRQAIDQPPEAIEVNAKQWAWSFRYPKQNITSAELHLPINHRIHLAMQSEDVIHGFYVPAFRLKQDIIPNKTIEFEFTPIREGKYRLSNSQFNGTYSAIMQSTVVVESPERYNQWLVDAASNPPVAANNQPFDEYTKRSKEGLKSGWKTIPPKPPNLVNAVQS
jgi:cytochrome c oxidase subunit II